MVGYRELRDQIALVVAAYNEALLNDLPPFRRLQPTTETLAGVLHQQVARLIEPLGVELVALTVWESPTQSVTLRKLD
jgi:6-pyruvoyl-tetrahydropterin synthase